MKRTRTFLILCWICLTITILTGVDVLGGEIASFHLILKDVNLLNLESVLKEYSPQIRYDGNISLETDLKIEERVIIANGNFSSEKVSLSGDSSLPLNLSELEGDFEAKLIDGKPVIKGKIRSNEGQWGRLYFKNLEADYSLSEKQLNIDKCEVELGDGKVSIKGNINFLKIPPLFDIKLIAEGVNIGSISEKWGNPKPISGILFSDANFSGEWAKPTTYSGKAMVKIEKGDIGKLGLIARLITFSPLAAVSGNVSLNSMEGDFNISEGYAYTENALLTGPAMKITAKGTVGWNKKLDFILSFYSSSEVLKGTPITKILGAIVDNFGNVLRKVKLAGTIDNPEFTIVPLGIGRTIKEGLEKSFENGSSGTNEP